ncbi:DNA invertase Pin-like site-specific DNA recombinase [Pantoea sp. AN62]|uniref:recombinase family protein n=2 Tax=Erwiniaceae TaxID=1903409 RepID=UPI000B800344|nr:recombinase family protein [Pantoea sp. AV62]OXM21396.1 hypothetical protein CBI35_16795 [Pantoea sp. AV62]
MKIIKDAVGYVRFSSAIQEQGTSIRRQRKLIKDWCDHQPQIIYHSTYQDIGKSAWKKHEHDERKAFLQMLEDRKLQRFPEPCYLLVEDASRLSRLDYDDAIAQMKDLFSLGFVVVFLATGRIYDADNFKDMGGRISFMVDAETYHKASEQKSHHSRKNWSQLRADAITTGKLISKSCARWVKPVPTGEGLPNHEGRNTTFIYNTHAQTIKRIFEMRLAGVSMSVIAQTLNSEDVPTLTNQSKTWNQSSVNGLLNNRAVIGDYVPSKKTVNVDEAQIIPGYYPRLISLADFQTVQAMREGKGRSSNSDNPTNVNLFKGILKCKCGSAVISSSVTPERYGYYVCSMYRLKRCSCHPEQRYEGGKGKGKRGKGNAISRSLVDSVLVEGLLSNLPLLLSGNNTDSHQLQTLEAEHQAIEQTLTNFESMIVRTGGSDRLAKLYQQAEADLTSKQSEIDKLRLRMLTSVNVETVHQLDLSRRADRIELNLIAKKHISEIRLDMKKQTCDVWLHSGFTFYDLPLNREGFDIGGWIHFFIQLNEKEYRFTGNEPLNSGLKGRVTDYVDVKPDSDA